MFTACGISEAPQRCMKSSFAFSQLAGRNKQISLVTVDIAYHVTMVPYSAEGGVAV